MMFNTMFAKVGILSVATALLLAMPVVGAVPMGVTDLSSDLRLDGENSSVKIEATFEKEFTDAGMVAKKTAMKFGLSAEDIAAAELDVSEDLDKADLKFTKETDLVKFTLEVKADATEGTVSVKVDKEGTEEAILKFIHKVHANLSAMHHGDGGMGSMGM